MGAASGYDHRSPAPEHMQGCRWHKVARLAEAPRHHVLHGSGSPCGRLQFEMILHEPKTLG